jgi:hypothetical protein
MADYIYGAAPIPNRTIALTGAITLLSGICGRTHLTHTGMGLNQFILLLAGTGTGKEAAKGGADRLLHAVDSYHDALVPGGIAPSKVFRGPSRFASGQGLAASLSDHPCQYAISAEFGKTLERLSKDRVPDYLESTAQEMLEVYSSNEAGRRYGGKRMSNKKESAEDMMQPSLTLLGESPVSTFYDLLSTSFTASGLLPRFIIFEPDTSTPYLNENIQREPSPQLVAAIHDLMQYVLRLGAAEPTASPTHIIVTPDIQTGLADRDYAQHCLTTYANMSEGLAKDLWTRRRATVLKLAALAAVANNPYQPVLTMAEYTWAREQVEGGQEKLIGRINTDDVGTGEARMENQIVYTMQSWAAMKPSERRRYINSRELSEAMHAVPRKFLATRLRRMKPFVDHRLGTTRAVELGMQEAVANDIIVELTPVQAAQLGARRNMKLYGFGPEFPSGT